MSNDITVSLNQSKNNFGKHTLFFYPPLGRSSRDKRVVLRNTSTK